MAQTKTNQKCFIISTFALSLFFIIAGIGLSIYGIVILSMTSNASTSPDQLTKNIYICFAIWVTTVILSTISNFIQALKSLSDTLSDNKTEQSKSSLELLIMVAPYAMYIWSWINFSDQQGWHLANESYPLLTTAVFIYLVVNTVTLGLFIFGVCCVAPCLMIYIAKSEQAEAVSAVTRTIATTHRVPIQSSVASQQNAQVQSRIPEGVV